jgi:hypothetical protein
MLAKIPVLYPPMDLGWRGSDNEAGQASHDEPWMRPSPPQTAYPDPSEAHQSRQLMFQVHTGQRLSLDNRSRRIGRLCYGLSDARTQLLRGFPGSCVCTGSFTPIRPQLTE